MTLTPAVMAAWIAQSTGLALLGLALLAVIPVAQAHVRLRWCQALLVAALVLPWLGPVPDHAALSDTVVQQSWLTALASPSTSSASVSRARFGPTTWVLLIWSVGSAVRVGWLSLGMWRLRTLRRGSTDVDDCALSQARRLVRVDVSCRRSDRVGRPVAFGLRRAVVLVPPGLAELTAAHRQAVWTHELLHIARGDVRAAAAEETLKVVLWWQPAVWLITAQARLAREQVVDAATVALTGAKRPYLEVLLWYATSAQERVPRPTLAFFTRRQLLTRIASLTSEVHMSRTRLVATVAGVTTVFSISALALAAVAPLPQLPASIDPGRPGALEQVAVQPSLDMPPPRRTVATEAEWPSEAQAAGLAARYRVHLVVDADGAVTEARVVEQNGGSTRPSAEGGTPLAGDGVAAHVAMRRAAVAAARQWQFDPPLQAPMLIVADVTVGPLDEWALPFQKTLLAGAPPKAGDTAPARVEERIPPPQKIHDVRPVYPEIARAANVRGVVIVDFAIEPTGEVSDVRVVKSIPLFDAAALDAAKQWRYAPPERPTRMAVAISFPPTD